MANDETPLGGEQTNPSSVALLPADVADQYSGQWNGAALATPAATLGPDLTIYLHALRRHWLMAAGIGLLLAAILGPAVWFLIGDQFAAGSLLRIAMQENTIAFQTDLEGVDRDRFEIYKNTQQQLVSSRFVLLAALRKPEISRLPVIKHEQRTGDPVRWLEKQLSVGFPGRAEIMSVSLSRRDPKEATTLVQAVVRAYLDEVVNAELDQKRERLNELTSAYIEKEGEAREKREALKTLAAQLGTSDKETLTLQQQLALEELTIYRNEMARSQFDIRRLQSEVAAQKAILDSLETTDVVGAEVELLVQGDPIARQLFIELGWSKMQQVYTEGAVVAGARSRYAETYQQNLQMMQDQFDARRLELAEMVRHQKRSLVQTEIAKLEVSIEVMQEQAKILQEEVAAQQSKAERFGNSSVDLEMMRAEIDNLGMVLAGIATEREKLRVEIRSTPRITEIQRAAVPEVPTNTTTRIALTALAMLGGLCCPAALVALWDVRAKRINDCADVSKGLQLPVIGSVPLIPARIIRRLGSPSKRYQTWHLRLTESVDGIAARVLRKAKLEACHTIMVSSAVGGEGKTTLATQLALSLARAGRTTVLVDFDLRRPAFDEVFGLPLEPGVCEAMQQEIALSSLVHEITGDNLAVVTAGRWSRSALASLSNGAAATLFKRLREKYDFVIVDTSPILPVADARFVSQHVDSVVLSIFRDISQAPKIQAACEILSAFGVNTVEAVVTGPNDNLYGEHMGYESTISA